MEEHVWTKVMAAEIIDVYVLMVSICTGTVKPVFRDHSEESKKNGLLNTGGLLIQVKFICTGSQTCL